jgi:predicted nuclease of predicted toxin-antitoxin system
MDPGISDDAVLSLANDKEAVLLTADRDFGELIFRQKKVFKGIILVRLAGLSPSSKADKVSLAVKKHSKDIQSAFSVITPSSIRIRKPA